MLSKNLSPPTYVGTLNEESFVDPLQKLDSPPTRVGITLQNF